MSYRHIKTVLGLFIVMILLASCQKSNPTEVQSDVDRLYTEYQLQASPERAEVYLDTLDSFIRNNISNPPLIKTHLDNGIKTSMAQGLLSRTPSYLLPMLRLYPSLDNRNEYLLNLGDVMFALRKKHAASVVFSELIKSNAGDATIMKKQQFIDSLAIANPDYVGYLFDQILVNPDELGVNLAASLKYVDAVEALALVSPENTRVPEHLYTAAEVARSMRTFPKAMSLYDWLIDSYPKAEKTPNALFIKGFILEQDYNRTEDAKEIYERFLEEFPTHDMAESAKFLLSNLGKTDEEILSQIEKNKAANK